MSAFAPTTPFFRVPSAAFQRPLISSKRRPRWCTFRLAHASLQRQPEGNALLDKLKSGVQSKQMLALVLLPQLPSAEAVSLLYESNVLDSTNRQVRLTAVATLGKLRAPQEANRLVSVLRDASDDYSVRAAAANALGFLLPGAKYGSGILEEALSALVDVATGDEHFILRYSAIVTMGNLGDQSAMDTLLPIAKNEASSPLEAAAALGAIGEIVSDENVQNGILDIVAARAADREEFVRAAVARTLKRWVTTEKAASIFSQMKTDEEKYGKSDLVRAILNDDD